MAGGKKLEYQIIGRYKQGQEVSGYQLACSNGKQGRFSREQVAFLIGKGQVINAEGRIYKDQFIITGVGCSLNDLPVKHEATQSNLNSMYGSEDKSLTVIATVVDDSVPGKYPVIGYVIRQGDKNIKASRQEVFDLTAAGKISNMSTQTYQGRSIIRRNDRKPMSSFPMVNGSGRRVTANVAVGEG